MSADRTTKRRGFLKGAAFLSAGTLAATKRSAEENATAAEAILVSGEAGCPCCKGTA